MERKIAERIKARFLFVNRYWRLLAMSGHGNFLSGYLLGCPSLAVTITFSNQWNWEKTDEPPIEALIIYLGTTEKTIEETLELIAEFGGYFDADRDKVNPRPQKRQQECPLEFKVRGISKASLTQIIDRIEKKEAHPRHQEFLESIPGIVAQMNRQDLACLHRAIADGLDQWEF